MKVEELLFSRVLPANSLCVLKRLEDILKENKTNSLLSLNGEAKDRAKACLMLLLIHSYGDLFVLNCVDEYSRLKKALNRPYSNGGKMEVKRGLKMKVILIECEKCKYKFTIPAEDEDPDGTYVSIMWGLPCPKCGEEFAGDFLVESLEYANRNGYDSDSWLRGLGN